MIIFKIKSTDALSCTLCYADIENTKVLRGGNEYEKKNKQSVILNCLKKK